MDTIIFDSEVKFRKYLIKNSENISNIIIFEDSLDNTIFFYSFTTNNLILASKNSLNNNFEYYLKIYKKIITKLNLNIEYETKNPKVLKLNK